MPSYQYELAIASAAAREAGASARDMQAGIQSTAKEDGSPVTPGDLAADAIIRHHLTTHFPNDAILSEEAVDDLGRLANQRVWIIDPIDGTKDYAAGGPGWAVQIALAVGSEVVLGILEMPALGVQLCGVPGHGATIVDAAGVRSLISVDAGHDTLIASSSPRNAGSLVAIRAALPEFGCTTCTSVGVKVHRMLQGEADLYVHARHIHAWDVAAPAAVLLAAGGRATDLAGAPLQYNTPEGTCPGLVFSVRDDHQVVIARLAAHGLRIA